MSTDNTPAIVAGGTEPESQVMTLTQEKLDEIIEKRISRERAKYADYEDIKAKASKYEEIEEANKSELQKAQEEKASLQEQLNALKKDAEVRAIKSKVSEATGVPAHLLTAESEEACTAQANAILDWKGTKHNYPSVNDGGEGQAPSPITKEEIMSIKNDKARLKAIAEHIDLF